VYDVRRSPDKGKPRRQPMYQDTKKTQQGILQDSDTNVSYRKVYGQKLVAISITEIKRGSFRCTKQSFLLVEVNRK
jgi:hypothetical protein